MRNRKNISLFDAGFNNVALKYMYIRISVPNKPPNRYASYSVSPF